MKPILLLATSLALLMLQPVTAQLRKVPAAVTEAFQERFPGATHVEWKDKLTSFEASFEWDDINHKASFNSGGEWKNTEIAIGKTDLPDEVLDGLGKSKYKTWEIKSVATIEDADGKRYRLVVQRSALQKKKLYFDETGQLQKDPLAL